MIPINIFVIKLIIQNYIFFSKYALFYTQLISLQIQRIHKTYERNRAPLDCHSLDAIDLALISLAQ
jgi:hypothetical protein